MVESSILNTGLSGLLANRQRVATAATNIVNAQSAGSPDTVFRPQRAVPGPAPGGGGTTRQEPIGPPFVRQAAPDHPQAGPDGTVAFPNVSPAREIVEIEQASASYEASARLVETADELQESLLDITDDSQ